MALPIDVLTLLQALVPVFLAICFLQSGLDKVVDRRGNLAWLTEHFARSPLARVVPLVLAVVTAVELAAGASCAVGAVAVVWLGDTRLAIVGVTLSAVALTMLFFGQRLAKDYVGAAVLVNYFVLALLGLYFLR